MKTLTEIQEQECNDRFGLSLMETLPRMDVLDIIEFSTNTAKVYASEAIKADRERVKQELDKVHATHEGEWEERYMSSDLIDKLPIELK